MNPSNPMIPLIPLSHDPQQERPPSSQDQTNQATQQLNYTTVNGLGIWNSWTRNFARPLNAIFDLIDNALDANLGCDNVQKGRITIERFKTGTERSGICLTNTSFRPIRPLSKVLEIFESQKTIKDCIGENGVGLKQACATLSDISFVCTKNKNTYEFGVLAKSIQRAEGCRFPSFSFTMQEEGDEDVDVNAELLMQLQNFAKKDQDVRRCVEEVGNGMMHAGLDKLLYLFLDLVNGKEWGDHVFKVLLLDLRQGIDNLGSYSLRSKERVNRFLTWLEQEMQYTYIHIPPTLEVFVGKQRVVFGYWYRRLVEFSKCYAYVDTKFGFNQYGKHDDGWKYSALKPNCYKLNIYMGFDAFRVKSDAASPASLYIYSRQFGRLIKYVPDARTDLGLSSGGTSYSQGLTIIVDDQEGKLPLNPTKQDLSFSEDQNGEAHKLNLYAWIGAYTHFFWHYHAEKFDMRKKCVTDAVAKFYEDLKMHSDALMASPDPSLGHMKLTIYYDVDFKTWGAKTIRWNRGHPHQTRNGSDTRFHLTCDEPLPPIKRRRKRKSLMNENENDNNNDSSNGNSNGNVLSSPLQSQKEMELEKKLIDMSTEKELLEEQNLLLREKLKEEIENEDIGLEKEAKRICVKEEVEDEEAAAGPAAATPETETHNIDESSDQEPASVGIDTEILKEEIQNLKAELKGEQFQNDELKKQLKEKGSLQQENEILSEENYQLKIQKQSLLNELKKAKEVVKKLKDVFTEEAVTLLD